MKKSKNYDKLRQKAEKILQESTNEFSLPEKAEKLIQELKTYQIELEIQNEELKDAQIHIAESQRKYFDLYHFAPVGYFTLNKKGMIQECNLKGASILGYNRNELTNMGFSRLISSLSQNLFHNHLKKLEKTKIQEAEDIELIKKDGKTIWCHLELILSPETSEQIQIALIDISRRKKAERALQESQIKLNEVINGSPLPQFVIDNNHHISHWNKALERYTGLDSFHMVGTKNHWRAFYNENRPCMADLLVNEDYDSLKELYEGKYWKSKILDESYAGNDFFTNLGEDKWLYFTASIIRNSKGDIIGAVETLDDITELKNAENKLKKSLNEKELLLKEIHHRVKNNLMTISSLLSLQSHYIEDKASREIFMESQNRAKSMALIHEKLYESEDIKRINIAEYVRSLISELLRSYTPEPEVIKIEYDLDEIMLDINTTIPLGLIINELVSNSFKHAFPSGESGKITIKLKKYGEDLVLSLQDNGIGFPDNLDFKNTESLGLQLVNTLTHQLEGNISLTVDNGSCFALTFRELKLIN